VQGTDLQTNRRLLDSPQPAGFRIALGGRGC